MASTVPLQRLGRPEEVAWLATYLASPAAEYLSGAVLTVGRRAGQLVRRLAAGLRPRRERPAAGRGPRSADRARRACFLIPRPAPGRAESACGRPPAGGGRAARGRGGPSVRPDRAPDHRADAGVRLGGTRSPPAHARRSARRSRVSRAWCVTATTPRRCSRPPRCSSTPASTYAAACPWSACCGSTGSGMRLSGASGRPSCARPTIPPRSCWSCSTPPPRPCSPTWTASRAG